MRLLKAASRWIFFSALIVAPWFYGATTAISIVVVNWLLGAAFLVWLVELIVNRRLPRFPVPLLFLVAALLVFGAWMTLNARSIYDTEFGTFALIRNIAPDAPGSVDYAISAAWMIRGVLLLISILFVVDLSRDGKSLIQLWQAIAIAGGSISLLGLLQKATGAGAIFWQPSDLGYGQTFFATYYYHANAGAYLNLVLPFTAGLAVRVFRVGSSPALRSLWLTMFVLNLAAVASNTSRGAQFIGALLLVGLCFLLGPRLVRGFSRTQLNIALTGAASVLLLLYALAQASHLEQPLERWQRLNENLPQDDRWRAALVAVKALPDAGLFGFGPGTFRATFPGLGKAADNSANPEVWRFLHEDYLQTVLEWGWMGTALWTLLFLGGIVVALRALRRQAALRREQRAKAEEPSGFSGSQDANFTAGGREHLANRPREAGDSVLVKTKRSASQRFSISNSEWSRRRRLILPLAIVALGGVALHSIVDFPLQIESIQLYVAICLGLCWSSAQWKSAKQKK